jgi:hypothetical protein
LQAGLERIDMAECDRAVEGKRDPHFDVVRNNRLRMGHLRYGRCGMPPDCMAYMRSIELKAKAFRSNPNRELLADIANLAEIVWCAAIGYWSAKDETEGHSLRVVLGDVTTSGPHFWPSEDP